MSRRKTTAPSPDTSHGGRTPGRPAAGRGRVHDHDTECGAPSKKRFHQPVRIRRHLAEVRRPPRRFARVRVEVPAPDPRAGAVESVDDQRVEHERRRLAAFWRNLRCSRPLTPRPSHLEREVGRHRHSRAHRDRPHAAARLLADLREPVVLEQRQQRQQHEDGGRQDDGERRARPAGHGAILPPRSRRRAFTRPVLQTLRGLCIVLTTSARPESRRMWMSAMRSARRHRGATACAPPRTSCSTS